MDPCAHCYCQLTVPPGAAAVARYCCRCLAVLRTDAELRDAHHQAAK